MKDILSQYAIKPLGNGPIYDRPQVEKREFELFYILSEFIKPRVIVEVGSWEGRSALSWGDVARQHDGVVICIDTWLGSTEHYENSLPNSEWERARIFLEDGYPSIYKTFVTTIRKHGLHDIIIPLPLDSHQAFILLERSRVSPDITYIDASHDYQSVLADLRWAKKIGSKIICGDDYYYYEHSEVKEAVDFFAKENNMKIVEKQWQFILLDEQHTDLYHKLLEWNWNDC